MKIIKIKNSHRWAIEVLFASFMFLIFVKYGLNLNVPSILLIGICLLISSLGDNNEIMALCICFIPLYTTLDYLYVLLYSIVILLIKNRRNFKIGLPFLFVIAICFWELLHGIDGSFSIKVYIGSMVPYVFIAVINSCFESDLNYSYIGIKYVHMLIIVSLNLLLRTIDLFNGNGLLAIRQIGRLGNIGETSQIIEGQINPNSLGVMCALGIVILLQKFFYIEKSKSSIIYVSILFVIALLTLSRTFALLTLVILILFLIDNKMKIRTKIKFISLIFIALLICLIIIVKVFPDTLKQFVERWLEEDLSNGRMDIMFESIKCILSNPNILLFGIGLQGYSSKVLQYVSMAPHDAITELIMIWGLLGLFLIISLFVSIIYNAKKRNCNLELINLIPLIIILVKALLGHLVTSGYTILTLSLVCLSIKYNFIKNATKRI